MAEDTIYGFGDEDSARRTVRAVAFIEKLKMQGLGLLANDNRGKVRVVTGTPTLSPAPPAAWSKFKAEIVVPSYDGSAVNGYLTMFTGIALLYPASSPAPVVGSILDAEVFNVDDTGIGIWVSLATGSSPSKAVLINTGTLITPGGGDLPYYAATEESVAGGWVSGSTVRAINLGTADPNVKKYPATFVGFAVDGVTRCYAIKAGKNQVLADITITCLAGSISTAKTFTTLDIDQW